MTTFHWIHIIAGVWLAFVNFMPFLTTNMLMFSNVTIGIIIAIYNAYMLFAQSKINTKSKS
jgi:hypothetical protein